MSSMTVRVDGQDDEVSTKESLKRAARRLFARHGVDAVSVRDIIREAGVGNASALNYYFGSKEELIRTLIRDGLGEANRRWDEALTALEARGGPHNVREVIEILVLRGLPPVASDGDDGSARFMATLLHTRRQLVTNTVRDLGYHAYDRAFGHLRRLMPKMPLAVKNQRLLFLFWSLSSILAVLESALNAKGRFGPPWIGADPLQNFIDASVGLLEAPRRQ